MTVPCWNTDRHVQSLSLSCFEHRVNNEQKHNNCVVVFKHSDPSITYLLTFSLVVVIILCRSISKLTVRSGNWVHFDGVTRETWESCRVSNWNISNTVDEPSRTFYKLDYSVRPVTGALISFADPVRNRPNPMKLPGLRASVSHRSPSVSQSSFEEWGEGNAAEVTQSSTETVTGVGQHSWITAAAVFTRINLPNCAQVLSLCIEWKIPRLFTCAI